MRDFIPVEVDGETWRYLISDKGFVLFTPENNEIGMEPGKTYEQKVEILKDKVVQAMAFENQYLAETNRVLQENIAALQENIAALQPKPGKI